MIVGIDIGATNTKIVFVEDNKIIDKMIFKTSKKTNFEDILKNKNINQIKITGGNKKDYPSHLFGIEVEHVDEISAMAKGALFNLEFKNALIISLGTGTCMIHDSKHIGGTSIGGGAYFGLSKLLTSIIDYDEMEKESEKGDLRKIDLSINDIIGENIGVLDKDITASNFGNVNISSELTKGDLILGIQNLIAESIFSTILFAAKSCNEKKIVLIGKLIDVAHIKEKIKDYSKKFNLEVFIPKDSAFRAAFGAAVS